MIGGADDRRACRVTDPSRSACRRRQARAGPAARKRDHPRALISISRVDVDVDVDVAHALHLRPVSPEGEGPRSSVERHRATAEGRYFAGRHDPPHVGGRAAAGHDPGLVGLRRVHPRSKLKKFGDSLVKFVESALVRPIEGIVGTTASSTPPHLEHRRQPPSRAQYGEDGRYACGMRNPLK